MLHIRRLEDGNVTASFPLPVRSRPVFLPRLAQMAYTPDGERLVTSPANTTALVWDWKRFPIAEEIGSGNTPAG